MEECELSCCRTCLAEGQQFYSIFLPDERTGTNLHLAEIVASFTCVQITFGDGLPEEICSDCADKTVMLYWFKQQVEECDISLKKKYADLQKLEEKYVPEFNGEDVSMNAIQNNVVNVKKEDKRELENFVDLKSEAKSDYSTDKLPDTNCIKFECDICALTFKGNDLLIQHKKVHNVKEYEYNLESECTSKTIEDNITVNDSPQTIGGSEDCESVIIQKEDLNSRPRICESNEFKYVCQVCFKTFEQHANLISHMRCNHSKNDKYYCTKCTHTFKKPEHLDTHLKIHLGRKPHTCEVCFKGFNHVCNMKDPMMTHNGDKPYWCTTCGKGFNNFSNLKKHQIKYSEMKPHSCTTCKKGFATKGELRKHHLQHTVRCRFYGNVSISLSDIIRQKHDSSRSEQRNQVQNSEQELNRHWPEKIPGTPGSKSQKKWVFLKCRMCTKKVIRRETSFRCKGCKEKPPLCPGCFEEWHDSVDEV